MREVNRYKPRTIRMWRHPAVLPVRAALALLWAALLFVCTCTYSFERMITRLDVRFLRNPRPDWAEFLQPFPDTVTASLALQKAGHFTGFLVLALLLPIGSGGRRAVPALALASGYAVLTEALQLLFFRDGRALDLLFDSAGIAAAYALARAGALRGRPRRPETYR